MRYAHACLICTRDSYVTPMHVSELRRRPSIIVVFYVCFSPTLLKPTVGTLFGNSNFCIRKRSINQAFDYSIKQLINESSNRFINQPFN